MSDLLTSTVTSVANPAGARSYGADQAECSYPGQKCGGLSRRYDAVSIG